MLTTKDCQNNRWDLVLSINCRPWLETACEKIPWKKGEHIWACFDKGDTKHRVKTNCFPTGNVLCVLGTPAQTYHHGRSYQHRNMLPLYQLLTNVKNKLANLTDNSKLYLRALWIFIGPESDHWLCLSLTKSLTNSLPFSKLDWCDPCMWRWQLKACWSCYCCWCWWWGSCWQQFVVDLFSKLDLCDPGVWRCLLEACWSCYCCWC